MGCSVDSSSDSQRLNGLTLYVLSFNYLFGSLIPNRIRYEQKKNRFTQSTCCFHKNRSQTKVVEFIQRVLWDWNEPVQPYWLLDDDPVAVCVCVCMYVDAIHTNTYTQSNEFIWLVCRSMTKPVWYIGLRSYWLAELKHIINAFVLAGKCLFRFVFLFFVSVSPVQQHGSNDKH